MVNVISGSLSEVLLELPSDAKEPVVCQLFSGKLLKALGFGDHEVYPEYKTGSGQKSVDRAARKNLDNNDLFIATKKDPYLLVELKGRDINLSDGSAHYHSTVRQLKGYMLDVNCKSVKWGIITNSCHVQLFRKHGKTIYPATKCIALSVDNIEEEVRKIRDKIDNPKKALTVAIYNNKGGVGKTTTTVNLAATLALFGKKVLAVDFDPNQHDLSNSLGFKLSENSVSSALESKDIDILSTIETYSFKTRTPGLSLTFDIIPADQRLKKEGEKFLSNYPRNLLYRNLEAAREKYDYIIVDSPPNWTIFSQLAVYAADVVLIPAKHNNVFSLENAAIAMKNFIPETQERKSDGTPVALPIFFNGERTTPPQLSAAQKEINNILKTAKQEGFDLLPYFYSRYTNSQRNLYIPQIPSYANIASAAFSRVPAVYRDRAAHEYYKNLAKEYFLQ